MKNIISQTPSTRTVVFIDDLDRCSSDSAVEVFESTKVLLDIEGFVFIIGLSHEKIRNLILSKFQDSKSSGEEYLRKIIQMPITIPYWSRNEIHDLIDKVASRMHSYSQIIKDKDNKELIMRIYMLVSACTPISGSKINPPRYATNSSSYQA
ncbi:MAG: hypothetical protein JO327_10375 [Nitrososphaeraceae archaeon]|nr:hypothetical protein [Nitrososphaeraceae archaeon]MBV9668521.1 hypothetical protein [Nitrososphaeraceae archaeon]